MAEVPTDHLNTSLDPLSYAVDVLIREARRHRRQAQLGVRVRQASGSARERRSTALPLSPGTPSGFTAAGAT